ncbi:MAG: SRPBCC family protein, partial [Cytophagales bacterium]|nr:SRPBCC family protein [Armatimonadota bacterium]
MPRLEFAAEIDAPLETVWAFYDTVESLPKVTPPQTRVRIEGKPGVMTKGVRFTLVIQQPPVFVPLRWETVITAHEPPHRFVDEQGKGPFAYWHHEHAFEATPRGRTLLRDTVTYTPPLGPLGVIADWLFIRRQLTAMF